MAISRSTQDWLLTLNDVTDLVRLFISFTTTSARAFLHLHAVLMFGGSLAYSAYFSVVVAAAMASPFQEH